MSDSRGLTDQQLKQLADELPGLHDPLVKFALRRCRRHAWSRGVTLPAGFQPEDFVQDATLLLVSGERAWPEGKPLLGVMMAAISSLVSNLRGSAAAREVPLAARSEQYGAPVEESAPDLNPEEELLEQAHYAELHEQLSAEFAGDPVATAVIGAALTDGDVRPEEIAQEHGLPRDRVYVGVRKVKRRAAELAKQWRRNKP